MIGAIRKRDIVRHPLVTIQCFGWKVFFRSLVARSSATFLSILSESGALESGNGAPHSVGRCIQLELHAARLYGTLAPRFAQPAAQEFFATLARQEHEHAELLELCLRATANQQWNSADVAIWRDAISRLERQMREADAKTRSVHSLADALWLALEIESSEINRIFRGLVGASGSPFIHCIEPFQEAGQLHLAYLTEQIMHFEPGLGRFCQRLLASFGPSALASQPERMTVG